MGVRTPEVARADCERTCAFRRCLDRTTAHRCRCPEKQATTVPSDEIARQEQGCDWRLEMRTARLHHSLHRAQRHRQRLRRYSRESNRLGASEQHTYLYHGAAIGSRAAPQQHRHTRQWCCQLHQAHAGAETPGMPPPWVPRQERHHSTVAHHFWSGPHCSRFAHRCS